MQLLNEAIRNDSHVSSTRIIFLIDLISCIGIAILGILLERDLTGIALVIGALLAPVSIAKGVQSFAERN